MSEDYRHAPKAAPDDDIVYRPVGTLVPILVSFALAFAAIMILISAVNGATTVEVTCGHQAEGGSCIITSTTPILGESNKIIALRSISGTKLTSSATKHGHKWGVAFLTTDGDVPISFRAIDSQSAREQQKAVLDAFLANPTAPSIKVHYDEGTPSMLALVFLELLPFGAVWILWQRVRVRFEWERARIVLQRTRWPFRPWTRSMPIDDVRHARLAAKSGSKGGVVYSVVFDLVDGETVPLSMTSSSGETKKQRTVDALNALLARRALPMRT